MLDRDVRILGLHLVDDRAPQAARRQDVGLVDAGQLLTPSPGQLERQLDDTPDLGLGVEKRVHNLTPGRRLALLRRPPEVETAGQFANDHHVHAFEERLAHRRARPQHRLDRHRPKVGVKAEAFAQRQERLLGPYLRPWVVVFRVADGAEVDGVRNGAGGQVVVAHRHAVGVDRDAADQDFVPLEAESEDTAGGLEDAAAGRDDLGSDAVAGNEDEVVGAAGRGRSGRWAGGVGHETFSPWTRPPTAAARRRLLPD